MAEKLTKAARQRMRRLIRRCKAEIELPVTDPSGPGWELQRQLAVEIISFERMFRRHLAEANKCDL